MDSKDRAISEKQEIKRISKVIGVEIIRRKEVGLSYKTTANTIYCNILQTERSYFVTYYRQNGLIRPAYIVPPSRQSNMLVAKGYFCNTGRHIPIPGHCWHKIKLTLSLSFVNLCRINLYLKIILSFFYNMITSKITVDKTQ